MMDSYTIQSKVLNKNRIFILQKSELEKRFDPLYYAHVFNEYEKKLINKPFKKFHQILKSINNGYDFREYKDIGTPYLKVANVKQGELDFTKIQYIDFNSSEISKNIQLKKGNLILTRKGTFGNAFALDKDYDFVISSEVFYIELNGNSILPKFLEIFFNSIIGQAQFDKHKIGAIMGSLSQEAIKELIIPFPSLEIQNNIISIYKNYIDQKKKNAAKAERLLSCIDDYLLGELGINIPVLPENTLKNRIYNSTIKTISGYRFDPYHHQKSFTNIAQAINKSKFRVSVLKHIIKDLKNGVEIRTYVEEGGIRYLRVTDLGKFGLNSDSPRYVKTQAIPDRIKLNENCILISRSGSLGLINTFEKTIADTILSSHIFKVELQTDVINPKYLEAYLRSKIGQSEIFRNNNGGVIPEINQEALKSIQVVVPPIEKQKEIANHISTIRQQAQQLKGKTKEILAQTNKEINRILLD
jgi:restriction endonuclease S subunit